MTATFIVLGARSVAAAAAGSGTRARVRTALGLAASLLCGAANSALAQVVLDLNGGSLTSYIPTDKTARQDLRPRFEQRGVDIDGTMRAMQVNGWAIAADSIGGGYASGRKIGDIDLATGTYAPTDIDLSLPSLGIPVVIGRSYNHVAESSGGGGRYDSNGYQGRNFAQLAHPELVMSSDSEYIYLVYGADRYVEFKRTGESSSVWKSKNGAAGAIEKTTGGGEVPDTYRLADQRGNDMYFMGFDAVSGAKKGQWWKSVDPAGMTTFVGDATTPATALSSGYDATGRITKVYDASDRRWTFTYAAVGGTDRLTQVKAETKASGTWASPGTLTTVGQVDYGYYDGSSETANGLSGDLRTVKVTMPGTVTADYVTWRYYRYYVSSWTSGSGTQGSPHGIKYVLAPEGARRADLTSGGSTPDQDWGSMSDATIAPYADTYLEYVSGSDNRVSKAIMNGCGCSAGAGVPYLFTYANVGSYATAIANTSYDTGWATRTVVQNADATYITQYFDEVGQVQAKVTTSSVPTGSPTRTWVNAVARDSSGRVTEFYSPASISGYTHSTGAMTVGSTGMITTYTRATGTSYRDGLLVGTGVKNGSGGSVTTLSAYTLSEQNRTVGSGGGATSVVQPRIATSAVYPAGSAETTTITTSFWSSTATAQQYLVPAKIVTTSPVVSTGKNGLNSATTTARWLRTDGSTAFMMDQAGIISYSDRNAYGLTLKRISDVNTGGTFASSPFNDAPSNWSSFTAPSTSGTAIGATTEMVYDAQGRVITVTTPSAGTGTTQTSAMAYRVMSDGRLETFRFPKATGTVGSLTYYGPCSYNLSNHAGRSEISATIAISSGGVTSLPSATPVSGTWQRLLTSTYDTTGTKLDKAYTYFKIPTTMPGSSGTNFDESLYFYDSMGRREKSVDATGTIRRTVFDERGMPVASWMGTSDTSFTSTSGGGNMVKTDATEYDGSATSTGGNGYVTKRTAFVTGSTTGQRVTEMAYDYRGRVTIVTNPQSPHAMMKYDDLNRVTATGQYSTAPTSAADPTSTSTNRVALSEQAYDERGQVYSSTQWQIVQSTGAKATGTGISIVTSNWYDNAGRLVKSAGASISKTEYDRLGRAIVRYVLAKTDDSTYAASTGVSAAGTLQTAANVAAGDVVVEESRTGYHSTSGRALLSHSLQRHHDASATAYGGLDSNADSDPLVVTSGNLSGRAQITAMWYDDLDRTSTVAVYGTNGGSTFTRTSLSAPTSSSSTVLVSKTSYDDLGNAKDATDPKGVVQRTEYDDAGRRGKVIDNYVNGTPGGGGDDDEDRVVEYGYTSGLVTSVTRKMPSSGDDQATVYTYGTTTSTSGVATGHLLSTVVHPEQTSGQASADRTVTTTYNAQGQVTSTTDCEGNVIENTYDTGGRVTMREATNFASGFDTRVKKIQTTYTNRGQTATVQQLNSSSTVLDEVSMEYDDWGNLKIMDQDPDSAISGGSGRSYQRQTWTHSVNTASNGWQSMKNTQWTNGSDVTIGSKFGTSGSIDDLLGRTASMEDAATIVVAEYKYLGARTVVGASLPEPQLNSEMYGTTGSASYSTYMDAFNRPIKQRWVKTVPTTGSYVPPVFVDNEVAYIYTSDVTAVLDNAIKDGSGTPKHLFDRLATYDGLRRLKQQTEGATSGLGGSISTQARVELFARNLAGKITSDKVSLDSNSTYTDGPLDSLTFGEMDDSRTYNKRNELRTRSVKDSVNPSTPRSVTLTYDKNGNLTGDGEKYTYKYNPWCQLVEVKSIGSGTPVVANFVYNGMGHRVGEQLDTSGSTPGVPDGVVDSNDPWFYMVTDVQGRRLTTYRGTDSWAKEQFLYHSASARGPGFTGGILLRDRDDTLTDPILWAKQEGAETLAERTYACSDFRGNVSALVTAAGTLVEQFRYSALGVPTGMPLGDVNGDGKVDGASGTGADYVKTNAAVGGGSGAYSVEMDVNLDGLVTAADVSAVSAANGTQTGRGKLSAESVGWRVGWRGMEWKIAIHYDSARGAHVLPPVGIRLTTDLMAPAASESQVTGWCPNCQGGGGTNPFSPFPILPGSGAPGFIPNPDMWRDVWNSHPSNPRNLPPPQPLPTEGPSRQWETELGIGFPLRACFPVGGPICACPSVTLSYKRGQCCCEGGECCNYQIIEGCVVLTFGFCGLVSIPPGSQFRGADPIGGFALFPAAGGCGQFAVAERRGWELDGGGEAAIGAFRCEWTYRGGFGCQIDFAPWMWIRAEASFKICFRRVITDGHCGCTFHD